MYSRNGIFCIYLSDLIDYYLLKPFPLRPDEVISFSPNDTIRKLQCGIIIMSGVYFRIHAFDFS
jgi:hypothetical protein